MGTIPLLSSEVAGPLGAIHLPRLWSKLLLSAKGQLEEGYPECGAGFDAMVLAGLGADRDAAVAYVKGNLASYPQFEAWIKANGTQTSAADIEASNAAIRGYNHDDDTRGAILGGANVGDDGSILDAVNLNNLEDWTDFHAQLTS